MAATAGTATLMAALRDERPGIAAAAADDLATLGDTAAIPRLIKGLGPYPVDYDVPIEVRAAEASALARLGNPSGIPLILDLLAEGTSLQVDEGALQWSRSTRNAFTQELALPGLVALAGQDFGFHPMQSVPAREAAVTAARAWWRQQRLTLWARAPVSGDGLATRARLLVAHLGAFQLRQIDGARYALTQLGPGVLPFLEEGLARDDDYQRLHGLEVMERLCALSHDKHRGRLAIVASAPLLEEAHTGIAAQAARVCGAARVPDPLVVALQRRAESEVLVSVLDALGRTGRRAAAGVLLPVADHALSGGPRPDSLHPDADVTRPGARAALAAAAFRLDPSRGPETLLAQLGSTDVDLAFAAVERLVELTGDDADLDPLAPAAERPAALDRARDALLRVQRSAPD